jgi:hypothetical protein
MQLFVLMVWFEFWSCTKYIKCKSHYKNSTTGITLYLIMYTVTFNNDNFSVVLIASALKPNTQSVQRVFLLPSQQTFQ